MFNETAGANAAFMDLVGSVVSKPKMLSPESIIYIYIYTNQISLARIQTLISYQNLTFLTVQT